MSLCRDTFCLVCVTFLCNRDEISMLLHRFSVLYGYFKSPNVGDE